jgi:hypothetical protein
MFKCGLTSPFAITTMPPDLFPFSPSESCNSRCWRSFLRSNGTIKIGLFSAVFLFSSLIVYLTFISSDDFSWSLPDWHLPSGLLSDSQTLADLNGALIVNPKFTTFLPSPGPDVLTLEQIRDIVTPTRGFFSRDFSLDLGWNNVSGVYCRVDIS